MTTLFQHPDYKRRFAEWSILRDLYDGEQAQMRKPEYLPLFLVEETPQGAKAYAQRLARSFYANLCNPIVWTWIGWMFQSRIDTEEIDDVITEDEMSNIDGKETSFYDFMQSVAKTLILYGPANVLVDSPNVESPSRGAEKAVGLRPYATLLEPLDVPDWITESANFSDYGKLKELHYEWCGIPARASGRDEPKELRYRRALTLTGGTVQSIIYRQTDDKNQQQTEAYKQKLLASGGAEWEQLDAGVIAIDEVPVVRGGMESWIQPCAYEMIRRHQLVGSFENILHYQAYKKIFVAGEPLKTDGMILAENSINFLKEGSNVIEVTSENPVALDQRIKDVTDWIFKIAFNQIKTVPGDSRQVQAEGTLKEERSPQIAAAKGALTELETVANSMIALWAKFKGMSDFDGTISLQREFTEEDDDKLQAQFGLLQDNMRKYPTWYKASLKKFVDRENHPEEVANEIKAEIDKISPEETQAATDQARSQVRSKLLGTIAKNGRGKEQDKPQDRSGE